MHGYLERINELWFLGISQLLGRDLDRARGVIADWHVDVHNGDPDVRIGSTHKVAALQPAARARG